MGENEQKVTIDARMAQKHDTEANWNITEGFIPLNAEIIIYDKDETYDYQRFKIGDGVTDVKELPFSSANKLSDLINDMGSDTIKNVGDPVDDSDAATKKYVDTVFPVGEGESSVQVGDVNTKAKGDFSLAIGYTYVDNNGVEHPTIANASGSASIGKGNITYGKQSVAFGCMSTTGAKDVAWDAEGEPYANTETPGQDLGKNSLSAGYNNLAFGESTIAIGSGNISKGKSSASIGNTNTTYGYANVALGYKNIAGAEAPKEDDENKQYYGHGSGGQNTISNSVITIGRENKVSDTQSIGIGSFNEVYSKNVLALGTSNIVSNKGDNSIVFGKSNEATAANVVNIGYNNIISKANVVAIGTGLHAGKDGQVIIGTNGAVDSTADFIIHGPNRNLLSMSESDGAYTSDSEYHTFTFPIADCRYFNYSNSRGPVFIADMTRVNEIPHLIKGQSIKIIIGETEYTSTIGSIWALNDQGNFTQNTVFGTSASKLSGYAFLIKESTEYGPIYTSLHNLGDIETLIANVSFKVLEKSLNLASVVSAEKVKAINAVIFGKNPSIANNTLFAIGNGVDMTQSIASNAFEVKNNGDVIITGDILDKDGEALIPKLVSDAGYVQLPTGYSLYAYESQNNRYLMMYSSSNIVLNSGNINIFARIGDVNITSPTKLNIDVPEVVVKSSNLQVRMNNGKITQLKDPKYDTDATNKKYVDTKVAGIVNSAPETLDTLNELSKALGDDPNFATTVANKMGLLSAEVKATSIYDTIINSQEEWDTMTASTNWNDARNILLKSNIKIELDPDGGTSEIPLNIPSNVLTIDGNGYELYIVTASLVSTGQNTCLRNCVIRMTRAMLQNINGIYNCTFSDVDSAGINDSKNIIGNVFKLITRFNIRRCDNIVLDKNIKEYFETTQHYTIADCTNIIYEKTKLSEFENDAGYITESEIPKKLSELENDIGLGAGTTGKDGKSAYEYAKEGGYTGSEEEFALKLSNEYTINPLHGKKVSFLGDSICAGSSDNGTLGGYGKIIADRNNMSYQNLGKGGATITAETYSSSTGYAKGWLCRMIENMDADADYAIIEGGINDAWQWSDHGNIEIGEITEGYNAELDETTYYGAFESMLKQLVTKFKGKKIGYIAVPKIMSLYDSERNAPNFYHIALECCAKWGVPVCDLNNIVPPTEYIKTLGSEYTTDGTHPTYEGYLKFYCDPIEVWMRTLTTGGSNSAKMVRKAVEEYTKGFNDAIEALRKGKLDNTGISFRKAKLPLADGTTIEIDVLTAVDGTVIVPFVNRVPLSVDTDGNVFGTDYNGDGTNDGYLKDTRLSSSGAVKEQAGCTVTGFIPVKGGDVIRVYGCDWASALTANNYICAYDKDFVFIGGYATTIGDAFSITKYGTAICSEYSADDNRNLTITLSSLSDIAYIRVSSKGHSSNNYPSFNSEDMIITVNEEIS